MKQSRKEIEITLRQKLAKQYNAKIEDLDVQRAAAWKAWAEEVKKRQDAEEKCRQLEEKVEQYEDWIHRLQEFMDIPAEVREEVIQKYRTEKILEERFGALLDSSIFREIYRL